MPVPVESLRDASQIEQWHREKGMLAFALLELQACGASGFQRYSARRPALLQV